MLAHCGPQPVWEIRMADTRCDDCKVFSCPNDCMNSIGHSDFANIGTWRSTRDRSECVDPYSFLIQIKDGEGA